MAWGFRGVVIGVLGFVTITIKLSLRYRSGKILVTRNDRQILNAPIVHLKRANGRKVDGCYARDPDLKRKGTRNGPLKTLHNRHCPKTIKTPLDYTGHAK